MATTDFTNGVSLSDAGWADDVDCSAYSVLSGVAGTNTITATGPATYSYASTRPPVWFTPAATNTGATTINITPSGSSALGAKNVFWNGAACVGGELRISVPVCLIYDGTQYNVVGAGHVLAATQAQQETGSVLTFAVTPGRQQFHPSACKGWAYAGVTGTAQVSYNLTSVTDGGAGSASFVWNVDFSTVNQCSIVSVGTTTPLLVRVNAIAAGSTDVITTDTGGVATDPTGGPGGFFAAAFGDQ